MTDNGLVRFAQDNWRAPMRDRSAARAQWDKTGAGVLTLGTGCGERQHLLGWHGQSIKGRSPSARTMRSARPPAAFHVQQRHAAIDDELQHFSRAGTRAITLAAGGGTIDTQGFATTIAQGITGAGALTKAGAGALTLTGNNAYAGGTTISAGTLQLGNGGTTGSIIGDVPTNSGVLAFNRSDANTFAGAISGTGSAQPDWHRHDDPHWRQHLYGRHHDQRRDLAARQWRDHRQHHRRRRE